MSEWWIRDRGRELGPFDTDEVLAMRANGQLQDYHECSSDGRTWGPIGDEPALTPRRAERKRKPRGPEGSPAAPVAAPAVSPAVSEAPRGLRVNGFWLVVSGVVGLIVLCSVTVVVLVATRKDGDPNKTGSMASGEQANADKSVIDSAKDLAGKIVPKDGGSPTGKDSSVITSATDEAAVKKAVGLVICGWRETKQDGKVIETPINAGTAFAVTTDGVLFTNKHVVEKVATLQNAKHTWAKVLREEGTIVEPTVWVYFDRVKQVAEVLHVSDKYDFAILKVAKPPARVFSLSRTPTPLRGLRVFALGFPAVASDPITPEERLKLAFRRQGVKPRVEQYFLDKVFVYGLTGGTVSRPIDIDQQEWLQHDATIHQGNSGGPLVTESGVVIGINTLRAINERENAVAAGVAYALCPAQLDSEIAQHAKGLAWK